VLLTNPYDAIIQYGDGDAVMELGRVNAVAPGTGELQVRAYFSGLVAKRDGAARCRVQVRLRRDQDVQPLASDDIGIAGAPLPGKLEISVGTTLAAKVPVTAGQVVALRMEVQRLDSECAFGAGAERVAQIFGRIEALYSDVDISAQ
jgi:hypothetical protein